MEQKTLTLREADIVTAIINGYASYDACASYLGISKFTVRNILTRLYAKSNAKNRVELVRLYLTGKLEIYSGIEAELSGRKM